MTETVKITLKGKELELKPTLRAARALDGIGGAHEALRKISGCDLNACCVLVAAGLVKRPGDVEDAVWEAGVLSLVEPLSAFVLLLANGGRSIKDTNLDTPDPELPEGEARP